MMGWMAPLRHLSAKLLSDRIRQQPAMPVIGLLNSASPEPYPRYVTAFRQGLSLCSFRYVEQGSPIWNALERK
jgi:hypothetical protein